MVNHDKLCVYAFLLFCYEATFAFFETREHGNCLFKWSYKMNAVEGRSKEETEGLMKYVLAGIVNNLEKLASSK